MPLEDIKAAQTSLSRVKKICNIFGIAFMVVCLFIFVWQCVAICSTFFSLLDPNSVESSRMPSIASLIVLVLLCVVLVLFFAILSKMFSGVAKGASPFSMKQVKRIRILALLLAIYFVLQTAASFVAVLLYTNGFDTGFFVVGTTANSYVTLDPGPLLISAIFFAISFIFEYANILQELSNDTL